MNPCATLFVIDETASLRRYNKLIEVVGRMRGYGVQFWLFFQALSQTKVYGEMHETISGLSGVVQYFGGTADDMTAKKVSDLTGKGTYPLPGQSVQFGGKPGGSDSSSLIGREVIMPDQVARWTLPGQIVSYTGRGATAGVIFGPELVEFPEFWVFTQAIEAGFSVDEAAEYAYSVPEREARGVTPAQVVEAKRKPFKLPNLNPFSMMDKVFANLLGHEDK